MLGQHHHHHQHCIQKSISISISYLLTILPILLWIISSNDASSSSPGTGPSQSSSQSSSSPPPLSSPAAAVACKSLTLTKKHAAIATPNFPSIFETPICKEWIIDAYSKPTKAPKIIYLYLNQMYLKANVTLTAYTHLPATLRDDQYDFDEYDEAGGGGGAVVGSSEQDGDDDGDDGHGDVGQKLLTHYKQNGQHAHADSQSQSLELDSNAREQVESNQIHKEDGVQDQSRLPRPSKLNSSSSSSSSIRYETSWMVDTDIVGLDSMVGPWNCQAVRNGTFSKSLNGDVLRRLAVAYTTCRYLSIKVEIYSPYASHLRVRNHLLDVYGFNISYEVKDYEIEPNDEYCSARECNYNGHCYVSADFEHFNCDCHLGRSGKYCQYDQILCNPELNLTFCENDGKCRLLGAGHGDCTCPEGFTGQICEINVNSRTNGTVCPERRQCQQACDLEYKNNNTKEAVYTREVRSYYATRMKKTTRMVHPQMQISSSNSKRAGDENNNNYNDQIRSSTSTATTASVPSCSCGLSPKIPKDWLLYEGCLQAKGIIFPDWEYKPTTTARHKKTSVGLSTDALALKFKIEQGLMSHLQRVYNESASLRAVEMTSFSSQSVFKFNFFGPPNIREMATNLLANLTLAGQLYEGFQLSTNFKPKIIKFPQVYIKNLTVTPSIPLQLDKDYSLTCVAFGSEHIRFKWFKDGVEINPTLAVRNIDESTKEYTTNTSVKSTSILMIDHAYTADKGKFTCQVSDFGDQIQCKDLSISVITQPIIEILPRSLTLVRNNTGRIVLCAATVESPKNYTYGWYKNGEIIRTHDYARDGPNVLEVTEPVIPYGLLLRIVKANESARFTCKIKNTVGESSDDIFIQVLPSNNSPSCRPEAYKYGLKWNLTGEDQTAQIPCPPNYIGFVQRKCTRSVVGTSNLIPAWGNADFSRCLSKDLQKINSTLRRFKAGFATLDGFDRLVQSLNEHVNKKGSLYSGEGEKIIKVLNDIGDYANFVLKKASFRESNFQTLFFETASSLLKFPGSCVREQSVLTLINLIHKISTQFYGTSSSNSNPFQNDVVVIEHVKIHSDHSQLFPSRSHQYPNWLNVALSLNHVQPNETIAGGGSFSITVLRNITFLLASNTPNDESYYRDQSGSSSISDQQQQQPQLPQIGSPIFYFSSVDFTARTPTNFILKFTLSPKLSMELDNNGISISCAALDEGFGRHGIPWIENHFCTLSGVQGNVVECTCDRPGKYAVLVRTLEKEEKHVEPLFHWSVLVGSISCILCCTFSLVSIFGHLHCRVGVDRIYTLKIIVCFSLIASILLALSLKTTGSSLILSTLLCTFLILCMCCQLTKTLNTLIATNLDLCPRLRSISKLNFVLLTTFTCTLPVWISATIFSQIKPPLKPSSGSSSSSSHHPRTITSKYDSRSATGTTGLPGQGHEHQQHCCTTVFHRDSPVFATFIGTLLLILFAMLVIYYKAALELRRVRNKSETAKYPVYDYRSKTLNRAVIISFGILILVTAIILNDWFPKSEACDYFYGFSCVLLGLIVLFSYTMNSEYPIPGWLVPYLICTSPADNHDFEKDYINMNSSLKTRHDDDSLNLEDRDEFQCSTINHPQRLRNNTFSSQNSSEVETVETFDGGSSFMSNTNSSMQLIQQQPPPQKKDNFKRTCSTNSVRRGSIVTFKVPRSNTNPTTSSSSSLAAAGPAPSSKGPPSLPNNGGNSVVMNGRLKNVVSNPPTSAPCESSCCLQHGSCQSSSVQRGRSQSNSSMASIRNLLHGGSGSNNNRSACPKPDREKCRLYGVDQNSGGCETSSFVFPSNHNGSSSIIGSHATMITGPITFMPMPGGRRSREEVPAYVPPSGSSHHGSSSSSFAPNPGPASSSITSSSASNSNSTLTNGYLHHPPEYARLLRNGFDRQLPLPPTSLPSSRHIYTEPDLQRISEGRHSRTDLHETDHHIYSTPRAPAQDKGQGKSVEAIISELLATKSSFDDKKTANNINSSNSSDYTPMNGGLRNLGRN